jgi:transposase
MSFFDKELYEVTDGNTRYVLCVNPLLQEEKWVTRTRLKVKFETEVLSIQKAYNREKDRCDKNKQKMLTSKKKNNRLKIKLTEKEIDWWKYRIQKAQKKYHMQKIYTITITQEEMRIEYNLVAYEEAWRYDWKYVFETTVPSEILSKEEVRNTYKKLQDVEHAFRDMKTVRLDLRPVFHRNAQTTRGHIFLWMLSYCVLFDLERYIYPYLKEKKNEKISFNDIMEELKTIRLVILSIWKHKHQEIKITNLSQTQEEVLKLLHIDAKLLTM